MKERRRSGGQRDLCRLGAAYHREPSRGNPLDIRIKSAKERILNAAQTALIRVETQGRPRQSSNISY